MKKPPALRVIFLALFLIFAAPVAWADEPAGADLTSSQSIVNWVIDWWQAMVATVTGPLAELGESPVDPTVYTTETAGADSPSMPATTLGGGMTPVG